MLGFQNILQIHSMQYLFDSVLKNQKNVCLSELLTSYSQYFVYMCIQFIIFQNKIDHNRYSIDFTITSFKNIIHVIYIG